MNERVCAVIVTYGCGERIAHTLPAILSQVHRVYIIDNGSDTATIEALKRCLSDQIHVTFNTDNVGLAAAQNQGIRQALADGYEWVLLLDDDSVPAADMVDRLLAAWRQEANDHTGILAPHIVEQNVQMPARYLSPGWKNIVFQRKILRSNEIWAKAAVVIASGSLIHADVFRNAGLMAEGFFIDYIDYEFCLRALQHGFTILVAGDAVLHHTQGKKKAHPIMGKQFITANYSTLRRYYIFRNRMFVLRRYGGKSPFLVLHEILAYLVDLCRIVCLEPAKIAKLRQAARGLKDGLVKPVPKESRL